MSTPIARPGGTAGLQNRRAGFDSSARCGYPSPDPLAPARGVFVGMALAGLFWLVVFVVLLVAFRT